MKDEVATIRRQFDDGIETQKKIISQCQYFDFKI